MLLKCAIIDDEPLAISIIEEHIERTPFLSSIQKFTHSVKVFEFLSENKVDVIFVDIQMPDLTGIQLVRNFRTSTRNNIYNGIQPICHRRDSG